MQGEYHKKQIKLQVPLPGRMNLATDKIVNQGGPAWKGAGNCRTLQTHGAWQGERGGTEGTKRQVSRRGYRRVGCI